MSVADWRLATNTSVVLTSPRKRGDVPTSEGLDRVTLLTGDGEREPSLVLALVDRTEARRHIVTMGYAKAKEMREVLDLALATVDRMESERSPVRTDPEEDGQ